MVWSKAEVCECDEGFSGPLCADRSVCVSGSGNLSDVGGAALSSDSCQQAAVDGDNIVCQCTAMAADRKSQVRRGPCHIQPRHHPNAPRALPVRRHAGPLRA